MGVDASAVARVIGIATTFVDLRQGSAQFLPQRIAVFVQGQSGVTYSSTKFQALSAGSVGQKMGYKSQAYLTLRELMPTDGRPGVGTIPVTVYPLQEGASAAAAAGDVTPSGTPTVAGSYRLRAGGIKTPAFVVPAGALTGANLAAALKNMGDAANSVLEFPMTVTYTYGAVTASALTGTGNGTITVLSVTGAPAPGVYRLKVSTAVVNGGVWTLTDPAGVVISSSLTMTPGAGGATVLTAGGIQFTLTDGSTDFGLNAYFDITVPATKINLTAAWKAANTNGIVIEILPESDNGTTFAITQPVGGLVNPDPTTAIAQMGNVWETLVLNAQNIDDTTTLDAFMNFGEGRWGTTVHKPLVVFTGNTIADPTLATAVANARGTDRVNCQLVAPGSPELPFMVAARELVPIAVTANNSPPTNYTARQATGVIPGTDGVQWDQPTRDFAVKRGSSTIAVSDGVVQLSDVMTMYKPTGENPPAYRYVVDIIKEMNVIYNIALIFARSDWAGAPLVADAQPTTLPEAKKPKMAVAEVAALFDSLGLNAILANSADAKKTIRAVIDSQNPKRLNISYTTAISGNVQIVNVENQWGFYYGTAA
jgi:phage tail sheath gpL-like